VLDQRVTATDLSNHTPNAMRCRSWLIYYATNRKVVGSFPDWVSGISHWLNPSCRTMALGSTLSLTEMSTRGIFWG